MAFGFLALGILWPGAARAKTSTNPPASLAISGFGFLGDREMSRLLRSFGVKGELPTVIDRTFVEDAALLLFARAEEEGFLHATLHARFVMLDGSQQRFAWTNTLETTLTNNFAARSARFKVERGVRFYYRDLSFAGLKAIHSREAKSYFVSSEMLLKLRRNRIFSPSTLRSSLTALREAYARAGYEHAVVTTSQVTRDEARGAVEVGIEVQEGLPTVVHSVTVRVDEQDAPPAKLEWRLTPGKPYSQLWQQGLSRQLQSDQYVKGFPDATVQFSELSRRTNGASVQLDLAARVQRGRRVYLQDVAFEGNERTKTSVLESRVKLEEGGLLNRVEAENSRQRLARLGVFDSVRLRYEEVSESERDVIFDFHEEKPLAWSLLGGFGTYELLRGGLEFEDRNVLGLAHNLRVRGLQSFKSSQGDMLYTVPEVFGENLDLVVQGSGLRRDEITFTRREYGGSIGIQKRLVPIKTDFSLRYDYEFLNALKVDAASTNLAGVQEARSAGFILELTRDRRDQPLLPQSGLKLFTRAEFAAAQLGGNVDYQRLFLGASYHIDLHGGRLIHLGLLHAVSFTFGGDSRELPFNKRFFPGGENSVRGYQEGKASPLDASGNQLGAETFTQANLEFEQLLTKSWSVVSFIDAVGFAQERGNYPWDEELYSVGGGVRWRTFIGPVRLEYGYNLHRRVHDPAGTLQFSVGFPF